MIKELDQIVLKEDLPEYGLQTGDIGTVVLIHQKSQGYEVEFVALDGETLAVVSLFAKQVRSIKEREIARVSGCRTSARRIIKKIGDSARQSRRNVTGAKHLDARERTL